MSNTQLTPQEQELKAGSIPRHVAIIMDGNGRWAKQRGQARSAGHYEGVNSVREVTRAASDLGVEYLTLYAFSTENWARPQQEVDILMHLIGAAIEAETPELLKNNVRLQLVGGIDAIPESSRNSLMRSKKILDGCTGMTLLLCLNYSSRWELTRAARLIADDVAAGRVAPEAVDASEIERRLSTYPAPDPDLLIRTGGEQRISNFLLWQIAYSELYFTDTLWPEFRRREFVKALEEYSRRERRYGKTSEQINETN